MVEESTNLNAFVQAAGAGLASAQASIAGAELATTTIAVAEASLEAKVAIESGEDGQVKVVPIGASLLSSPAVKQGSVSTLTLNFVALADDSSPTAVTPPSLKRDDAIAKMEDRDDVKRLENILCGLVYNASIVPERSGWLVSARDSAGRLVRESLIADQ